MPILYVRKQSQHLGVRFWKSPGPEGEVLLVNKNDHCVFGQSIKVGMTIKRINGEWCHSIGKVTDLLEKAPLGHHLEIEVSLPTCMVKRTSSLSRRHHRRKMKSTESDDLTCTDVSEGEESTVDVCGDLGYQYQYNLAQTKNVLKDKQRTAPVVRSSIVAMSSSLSLDSNRSSGDLSFDSDYEDDDVTVSSLGSCDRLGLDAQDNIFFLM